MEQLVLIVEDEHDVRLTLERTLQRGGYQTRAVATAARGLEQAFATPAPDLILLDLMLPDLPGTQLCQLLRADNRTKKLPIIMLTARTAPEDRIGGLEVGADDYMGKPYSPRELLLRVKALLRRCADRRVSASDSEILRHGILTIDRAAHQAWVEDVPIQLTAQEFKLLATLMVRGGRVQSRDVLIEDVWGLLTSSTTRTIDTHVRRLRVKLGAASDYIETVRGVGYRFRAGAPPA